MQAGGTSFEDIFPNPAPCRRFSAGLNDGF
jgi:hypothetical protein